MNDTDYTQTISVRVTKMQFERLKTCAAEHGVSGSNLIRRWISEADVTPVLPQRLIEHLRGEAVAISGGTIGGGETTPRQLIEYRLRQQFGAYWQSD